MIAFARRPASSTLPTVDVIVQPKVPFERIYQDRLEKDLGGVRLSIASIDALIELKSGTGRKVDAIDYSYETDAARILRYRAIPELERLRWLEEICVLTNMFRQAPEVPNSLSLTVAGPAACKAATPP